jgi:hypothetical protein
MKLLTIIAICGAGGVLISSCQKERGKEVASEQLNLNNSAQIQVYNASIPNAATDPRRNMVFVDAKVVNGASITYGSLFPSSSTSFAIPGGFNAFLIRDTVVGSVQPQISFAENFQAAKYYTIFMYDTFTAVKQKTVETKIEIPVDTTARVRVANFVYHPTPINGIDIFSKKRNAFIVTNLLPTQVTDFFPYASSLTDTLYVSETGNPANQLDTLNGFNPNKRRSYTLIFRGRWRTNEFNAAPNPRVLTFFANN